MGIEPTLEAWEAAVLPLNYTRVSRITGRCAPRTEPHYTGLVTRVNRADSEPLQ